MCGRFMQNYTSEQVHAFLSVFGPARNLQPHYNIAPTDTVDVIRLDSNCCERCTWESRAGAVRLAKARVT